MLGDEVSAGAWCAGEKAATTSEGMMFGMSGMRNLCHFEITIGDEVLPRADPVLVFSPDLVRVPGTYATLRGHFAPVVHEGLSQLRDEDDDAFDVIVPRFAPAIAWAIDRGLEPWVVPLRHLGDRESSSGAVVLERAEDLEPVPGDLAVRYPQEGLPPFEGPIVRLVQGEFVLRTDDGLEFAPVAQGAGCVEHSDGRVELPEVPTGTGAVIVPYSGPSVRAAAALGLAVLVRGPRLPGKTTVPLYRVA